MNIEILQHRINYNWLDDEERELNEFDIKYIEELIKKGYNQGELWRYEEDKTYRQEDRIQNHFRGWWNIQR